MKIIRTIYRHLRKAFRSILRFFNLLEPDVPYMVLSVSKLSVWATLFLTIYVVGKGMGNTEVAGALLANLGSISNYAYRRHVQVKTQTGAYSAEPETETDEPA